MESRHHRHSHDRSGGPHLQLLNARRSMSSSRAESQQPPYGRKRSNTAQSINRPPPTPCRVGDQITLTLWVHEPATSSVEIIFDPAYWPGINEGDLIEVKSIASSEDELSEVSSSPGFLFTVRRDESLLRPGLQVRICIVSMRISFTELSPILSFLRQGLFLKHFGLEVTATLY